MSGLDTTALVERSKVLYDDVADFARRLSEASQEAIGAVNPNISGTELGDEWPLTFDLTVESRVRQIVNPGPARAIAEIAVCETAYTDVPQAFIEQKIRNDVLGEAYNTDTPRTAFAIDIASWVMQMEQTGWPLLVTMSVQDRSRVKMSIYEDTEQARAYFAVLADKSRLTEEDIQEGSVPYSQIGSRIVVDDPVLASDVAIELEATQS